jgi:hypothetical protein
MLLGRKTNKEKIGLKPGMVQGRNLSPVLFNLHVDRII